MRIKKYITQGVSGYLIQCQFLLTNIKIIVWQIVRRITIEIVGMRGYMIDKKLLVMSGKKQKRQLFSFFFIRKKQHLCQRTESCMFLAPLRSCRVSISHQSDRRIRVHISHQSESRFVLSFERLKFQQSNGGFGESDWQNGIIFQNEKCWLFCVSDVYFTALHEKCDTIGQMKDIRLPIVSCYSWCENGGQLFESKQSSVHCSTIMVIVPSRRE